VKLAGCLIALLAAPVYADAVTCHIIYGGENFSAVAAPTSDPYTVQGQRIGRYFEFKVSYVAAPTEFSAISIYVYSTVSGESVLLHQAKYPADAGNSAGPWGFTGFNYVYEPSKNSELQYWCEKTR
jgi:hypothetical protein